MRHVDLIRILLLAIAAAPAFAHFLPAVAALDREDPATARAALERALEIEPAMAEGHRELSIVCAQLGDPECSRRLLELYSRTLRQAATAGVDHR